MKDAGGFGRGGRLLLALAAGAAVFGIATAVQASIPDSKGVIHACYAKISGALRVIDTAKGQTCSGSEYGVNWNQRGPTGSRGPTGQPGVPGQQGAKGATGPHGVTGAKGATGAVGPTGSQGDPGSPGTPGTDGQDVTGAALAVGDAHCPNGGTLFTAVNGPFYACNGSDGSGGFGTGYQTVGTGQMAITQDGSDVVSLTIPNGAPASAVYLVTARVGVQLTGFPGGGQSALASCVLMDGAFPLDLDSVSVSLPKDVMIPGDPPVPGTVAGNQDSSMTLVGGDSFSAGAVLHVRCSGFPPSNASFTAVGKIVAIKGG